MMKIGGIEYMEINMIMISSHELFSVVNNSNTVPNISLVADVFTFFSMKSCSKLNSNDSFGFCSS